MYGTLFAGIYEHFFKLPGWVSGLTAATFLLLVTWMFTAVSRVVRKPASQRKRIGCRVLFEGVALAAVFAGVVVSLRVYQDFRLATRRDAVLENLRQLGFDQLSLDLETDEFVTDGTKPEEPTKFSE